MFLLAQQTTMSFDLGSLPSRMQNPTVDLPAGCSRRGVETEVE